MHLPARALVLVLTLSPALCAAQGVDRDVFQIGAFGGIAPSEPVHTEYLVGGWMGVGIGPFVRLEVSGSFRDGLTSESDLGEFLRQEALLDPEDPVADRTRWTAEGLLRVEPLRGKWALLQSTATGFAAHLGFGGGVRAVVSGGGNEHLTPTGLTAVGLDLRLLPWLLFRTDVRGYGVWRRDDSMGFGAEVLLGLGGRV